MLSWRYWIAEKYEVVSIREDHNRIASQMGLSDRAGIAWSALTGLFYGSIGKYGQDEL